MRGEGCLTCGQGETSDGDIYIFMVQQSLKQWMGSDDIEVQAAQAREPVIVGRQKFKFYQNLFGPSQESLPQYN